MNLSQKCNCCACEQTCKWKDIYQNGVQAVLETIIKSDANGGFWKLRDCPHIEVSIKCSHMITRSSVTKVGGLNMEWISVKDRVPDEAGTYIVTAHDGHKTRVTFRKWQNRFKCFDKSGSGAYWNITHWMPLPEPPKEG